VDKPVFSNAGAHLGCPQPCAAMRTKGARRHTTTLPKWPVLWITNVLCQKNAQAYPQAAP